jgi:S-DNA-T family DNA segregation ATPase FtsK/SpoIIIE
VSSKVDSRTVLDQSGAENLLGSGDMLFSDRGASPVRLHGCYVDEEEIHKVVSFLKTQGKPVYNLDIIKPREEEGEDGEEGGEGGQDHDELYDKAVTIVAEAQRVSVSYLQRRLSVGYNRSAKLVERMEREGVVSAPDNKKQREVLIAAA